MIKDAGLNIKAAMLQHCNDTIYPSCSRVSMCFSGPISTSAAVTHSSMFFLVNKTLTSVYIMELPLYMTGKAGK
jgi:hypothetical protein